MPLTTPLGALARPQAAFVTQLADCATFRTMVGAADQAGALPRIHQGALRAPISEDSYSLGDLRQQRPFAIVWTEPQAGLTRSLSGVGGSYAYGARGNLLAYLESDWPLGETDPSEIERQWQNSVGQIIDELLVLSGQAGYIPILELTHYGPFLASPEEAQTQGESIASYLDILWGTGG